MVSAAQDLNRMTNVPISLGGMSLRAGMSTGSLNKRMPNKQNKSKTMRSGRAKQTAFMGANARTVTAPVATGVVTRGGRMEFGVCQYKGRQGLKVRFRMRWGYLITDTGAVTFHSYASNTDVALIRLDPSIDEFPSGFRTLARLFNEYRWAKVRVEYTAQTSTAVNGSYTIAYVSDYNRAIAIAAQSIGARMDILSELDGSVSFPVYANGYTDIKVENSELRPTFMDQTDEPSRFLGTAGAIVQSGGNFAEAHNGQQIWLEGELELYGFNPLFQVAASLHEEKKEREPRKFDQDEPVIVAAAVAQPPLVRNQQLPADDRVAATPRGWLR